jgi:polysaccharide export outer membrane protein
MRRSLLFLFTMLVEGAALLGCAAQTPPAMPERSAPPAQLPKPPVSLSPAMPTVESPADPARMAEPAGGKAPGSAPVDVGTFVLGAQDQISVTMWDEPNFNGEYIIRPDGFISMKLIGEIKAAGLTPVQLQDAINKAALSQLKTPRSSVNVIGVHSKHVYFDGEGIGSPGAMDLVIPIHLLEAISARGGFKDFANKKKITILRDNKPLMIDHGGGKKSKYVNYSDTTSGKHPESNPLLLDGDHVIVN